MARLLDDKPIRFNPGTSEAHHSITIGAALYDMYVPLNAKCVLIQATAKDIRFTLDGTAPTGVVGFMLVASAAPLLIEITEHTKFMFFGSDAAAMLNYCFGE